MSTKPPSNSNGTSGELFSDIQSGSDGARADLLRLVEEELRRIVRRKAKASDRTATFQTTAVVNEVYLRLFANSRAPKFESREHFLWAASRATRDVLVELARARLAKKRGGGRRQVALEESQPACLAHAEELLAVSDLAERLSELDADAGAVFELRYFGGLTEREAAAALSVSEVTVRRRWAAARTLMARLLGRERNSDR